MAKFFSTSKHLILMILLSIALLLIPLELNAHGHGHYHHQNKVWLYYNTPNTNIYYGPKYNDTRYYWTGWAPYYKFGYVCQKRCLINDYNGAVFRCVTRCY